MGLPPGSSLSATASPLVGLDAKVGRTCHIEYEKRGMTAADIARGYVALLINSNYSRDLGLIPSYAAKPKLLGTHFPY